MKASLIAMTLLAQQPQGYVDFFLDTCLAVPDLHSIGQKAQQNRWQSLPAEMLQRYRPNDAEMFEGWTTGSPARPYMVTITRLAQQGHTLSLCSTIADQPDIRAVSDQISKRFSSQPIADHKQGSRRTEAWTIRIEGKKVIVSLLTSLDENKTANLSAVVVD